MPEILEVEYYRRAASAVAGRSVRAVETPDDWYLKGGTTPRALADLLIGSRIGQVRRRGKLLVVEVTGPDGVERPALGMRFGMTGRLIVDGAAPIDQLRYSSTRDDPAWDRFGLVFADGGRLVIRDPRRLGGVEIGPDEEALGPDALTLTRQELSAALEGSRTSVKARLLDQSRVAGLGNMLVDEILWRAGIDPARSAGSLTAEELARLVDTVRSTLSELLRRGGSHLGRLPRDVGEACPGDGTPLQRRTIGGRTTVSCPTHQA